MNIKQLNQLAEYAGPDLARQIDSKLKELAQLADGEGLHKKATDGQLVAKLKARAGWTELDEQRAAARKVAEVQQLVDDFTALAGEALASGDTDIQPLIDELAARLDLDSATDADKAKAIASKPFEGYRKPARPTGLAAIVKEAAGAGAPAGGIFQNIVATNQAYERQPGGNVAGTIAAKIKARRWAQREEGKA